jgi:hypothetical protein
MRFLFILITGLISAGVLGQSRLQTVAESSGFKSTSAYSAVKDFITELQKSSKFIRVESIAKSAEGRDVPLLVIGKPLPPADPLPADDKRLVIYIQANIHAGEVEGKEASLMFIRDLLSEKDPELLKNLVILVCPNFNPDGNEKISPQNRINQNGPVNGVGLRYNGQFLDLNRDGMKAESPEVRGLIQKVFNTWDPAVFLDCHTTNGSYHVEPVTFTWMVNPNGDRSLINYMRDKMVPSVSGALLNKYKIENCMYGEFRDMLRPQDGWFYDASDPRYMTNYYGLRNRLAILNENYVYADYRSRVFGCYYLIKSVAEYSSANSEEIKKLLKDADNRTIKRGLEPGPADSFATEYKVKPAPAPVTIQTYEAEVFTDANGRRALRKSDSQIDVTVPYYVDYYGSAGVRLPFAYALQVNDRQVLELLAIHGIWLEKLSEAVETEVHIFEISELKASSRLNQGHYTNSVKGTLNSKKTVLPAGTVIIRTAQPLANVAAYLLEPQSNDGLMTWNFFDKYLVPQWGSGYFPYPVMKIPHPLLLKTERF